MLLNLHDDRVRGGGPSFHPHFTGEETEAQGGEVTWPKLHRIGTCKQFDPDVILVEPKEVPIEGVENGDRCSVIGGEGEFEICLGKFQVRKLLGNSHCWKVLLVCEVHRKWTLKDRWHSQGHRTKKWQG